MYQEKPAIGSDWLEETQTEKLLREENTGWNTEKISWVGDATM